MHQLDDMKTYAALPALAAGATAAMIVVIAPLQAKDSFSAARLFFNLLCVHYGKRHVTIRLPQTCRRLLQHALASSSSTIASIAANPATTALDC